MSVGASIPDNNPTGISRTYNVSANFVVEHVEVFITATHSFIGDLRIRVTSPAGTVSDLTRAPRTDPQISIPGWRFTTVKNWGESSAGTWTVNIADLAGLETGTWDSWEIRVYGAAASAPTATPGARVVAPYAARQAAGGW